jgi:hypothetical protein
MEEPPSVASPHKRVELVAAECDQPEDTVFMHQRVRRTSVEAARPSACGATLDSARQTLRALRGWRLAGCLGAITVVALLAGLLGGLLPRPTGPAAVGRTPDLTASIVLTLGTRLGTTGEPKRCVLVNGTSPGPLLRVRKGDLVSGAAPPTRGLCSLRHHAAKRPHARRCCAHARSDAHQRAGGLNHAALPRHAPGTATRLCDDLPASGRTLAARRA